MFSYIIKLTIPTILLAVECRERAVAIVINTRMKKRGMRWKRANATAVVTLRVQQINAHWHASSAVA